MAASAQRTQPGQRYETPDTEPELRQLPLPDYRRALKRVWQLQQSPTGPTFLRGWHRRNAKGLRRAAACRVHPPDSARLDTVANRPNLRTTNPPTSSDR